MNSARLIPILGSSVIFFVALLGYFFSPLRYNEATLTVTLFLCGILVAFYALSKEEYPWLKGQALKCSVLFLIGYIIVHFQCYIDILLKNISPDDSFLMVDSRLICRCAWLSLIGLAAFVMGYFVSKGKLHPSPKSVSIVQLSPLIIFATAMLPIWILSVGFDYFMGGYGRQSEIEVGSWATYTALIFEMSLYAVPLLHARNLRIQGGKLSFIRFALTLGWYNLLLCVFAVLVMLSGDRGPLIATGLFYFIAFLVQSGLKLSKLKFGMLVFIAAFVFTLLGVVRSFGPGVSFSDKISIALETERRVESVSPQTLELAGSVRCLHYAVDYVPSQHNYLGGRFSLKNLCAVVPTGSRWLHILGLLPQKYQYAGSASFVTWVHQGDNPTYGDGVTCVADLYIDLGVFGVALGMFVWGFWARRFDINLWSPNFPSLLFTAFIFIYTVKAVYIPRSSMMLEFKSAIWLFIILFVYEKFFGTKTFSVNRA